MRLYQCYATRNACYQAGQTIVPRGIMVHSTGANNPYLRRYVQPDDGRLGENTNGNHFNVPLPGGRQVCVHAFIRPARRRHNCDVSDPALDDARLACGRQRKQYAHLL